MNTKEHRWMSSIPVAIWMAKEETDSSQRAQQRGSDGDGDGGGCSGSCSHYRTRNEPQPQKRLVLFLPIITVSGAVIFCMFFRKFCWMVCISSPWIVHNSSVALSMILSWLISAYMVKFSFRYIYYFLSLERARRIVVISSSVVLAEMAQ